VIFGRLLVVLIVSMVRILVYMLAMIVIMTVTVIMTVIMTVTMTVTMVASMVVSMIFPAKMVVPVSSVQNLDLNQVENQSYARDQKHNPSLNFWRLEKTICRFNKQPKCHYPHRGD